MSRLLAIAAVLAALGLIACGDDEETTAPAAETDASEQVAEEQPAKEEKEKKPKPKPEPTGTEVKLASSDFGQILFDADDQAIYLFDKETTSESECYGECAVEWPPVLTKGEPKAGSGIDSKLLGTTKRNDGSTQVTYNGHPLYYYFDEGPGQVLCHNVPGFGGLWLVLDGDGNPV